MADQNTPPQDEALRDAFEQLVKHREHIFMAHSFIQQYLELSIAVFHTILDARTNVDEETDARVDASAGEAEDTHRPLPSSPTPAPAPQSAIDPDLLRRAQNLEEDHEYMLGLIDRGIKRVNMYNQRQQRAQNSITPMEEDLIRMVAAQTMTLMSITGEEEPTPEYAELEMDLVDGEEMSLRLVEARQAAYERGAGGAGRVEGEASGTGKNAKKNARNRAKQKAKKQAREEAEEDEEEDE